MIQTLIEGLLPGMRSLRAPLISGLVWTLVFWLLASPLLPAASQSSPFIQQALALIAHFGPSITIAVASVMIFVIGATVATIGDGISFVVGRVLRRISYWWGWQRQIRQGVSALESRRAQAEDALASIQGSIAAGESSERHADQLRKAQAALDKARAELTEINERSRWIPKVVHFARLRQTPRAEAILGPPTQADSDLAKTLAREARQLGQIEELEKLDRPLDWSDISFSEFKRTDGSISEQTFLKEAAEGDPLEMLRAVSETLHSEMDRQRSEREVRIALSLPLALLLILLGYAIPAQWVAWLAGIPLGMMVRLSLEAADERINVLRLLRLNKLATPSLKAIVAEGRADVRLAAWDRDQEEREQARRLAEREQIARDRATSTQPGGQIGK